MAAVRNRAAALAPIPGRLFVERKRSSADRIRCLFWRWRGEWFREDAIAGEFAGLGAAEEVGGGGLGDVDAATDVQRGQPAATPVPPRGHQRKAVKSTPNGQGHHRHRSQAGSKGCPRGMMGDALVVALRETEGSLVGCVGFASGPWAEGCSTGRVRRVLRASLHFTAERSRSASATGVVVTQNAEARAGGDR